jgi:hypothetical protein
VFVGIATLACLSPVQSDTWWLLRAGQEIWLQHHIPLTDSYSHTAAGLYWPNHEGEPESPLGPQVAEAASAGYTHSEEGPQPFHGYYYRVLLEQGSHAPGGAKAFVDERGRMTRGYAMVARPAKHGNSGVMTFLVGAQGIVYQKDLGEGTEAAAAKLSSFDPDESWDPTGD